MKRRIRFYLIKILKIFDVSVMLLSFVLIAMLYHNFSYTNSLEEFVTLRLAIGNFAIIILWLFIWHEIFNFFNLYKSKRLSTSYFHEALDIVKAVSLAVLSVVGTGFVLEIEFLTLDFIATFWLLAMSALLLSRIVIRYLFKYIRRWGRNLNYVLIVGTNPRALKLARVLKKNKILGYIFLGFVDDSWVGRDNTAAEDLSLVCNLDEFQDHLRHHAVDEVIICIPIKSLYDRISSILAQCEEQGITVRFMSDFFPSTMGRSQLHQFNGYSVATIDTSGINGEAKAVKHSLDFLLSLCLLLMLLPMLFVIAILIKIDSAGPALFKQERIGLNKRRFLLYKFRTMRVDAEQQQDNLASLNVMDGPVFKIPNDPRITTIGRFLRKTSLDELPQLINILKGDMSLVGPRPLPVRDYQGFNKDVHRRRCSVRPGITCLWQVAGRNSIPFEQWMELDLEYIDHWSLWLDIKIMFKTIPSVVRGTGV